MKQVLELLGSLKVAVILLVLLLVALSAGTILESRQSAQVAQRVVYFAPWFIGVQALLALNVFASVLAHYPWGTQRIGYVLTHGSILLILVGAVVTWRIGIDGQLGMWEGDSNRVVQLMGRSGETSEHQLPFTVTLEDFQIETYPGTMRPAQFRSRFQIADPDTGQTISAAVWMNNPYTYRGYTFFQSSYQQAGGREASVFSVAKDPGQPIAFTGYVLLVVGMIVVLVTRISQAKRRAQLEQELLGGAGKTAVALLVLLLSGPALAAEESWVDGLRRLPVQHDGRAMPLDTLARESVWKVTGKRSFGGVDPVASVAEWYFTPMAAANTPLVALGDADLAAVIGLPEGTGHASFAQLVNNRNLLQLMDRARQEGAQDRKRTGVVAAAEAVEERLVTLQGFLNREAIRSIPPPGSPTARWAPPQASGVPDLLALARGPRPEGWPTAGEIDRELLYNASRPTRISWLVLLAALVVSLFAWSGRSRWLDRAALAGLAAGFAVMTWGIGTRWAVAGRIPAANMYESLLFLAWGVGLFAVVAFALLRNRLVVLNANAMAALTMALTDLLPIDGFIHPVPPVLAGTVWLAIHVPIIMVSYSVYALGVIVAHMQIGFTIFAPRRRDLVQKMYDLLYWYMMVGGILLIAGILTGSAWAASSWGRYWGWDPKEVWSLVAFLAYMAILHAKVEKLIGQFGVAAISILAFQTILMTYLGVNYVLAAGLHSYGFGDSPVVTWMIVVGVVETAFVVWGWLAYLRQRPAAAAA